MSRTKAVYDGYQFDFDLPHDREVTGAEIQQAMTKALGRPLVGAPAVQRSNGYLEHIDARELVKMEPGDRIIVTPVFETAANLQGLG